MLFVNFIFKNLFRNKKKFLLTIFCICLVFSLLLFPSLIMENCQNYSKNTITATGDFVISLNATPDEEMGLHTFTFEKVFFTKTELDSYFSQFKNVSGVENLFYIINCNYYNDNPINSIYSVNSSDLHYLNLTLCEGKFFSDDSHVIIDKGFARQYGKSLGDVLTIKNKNFTVCGIYGNNLYFSNAVIFPLDWDVLMAPYHNSPDQLESSDEIMGSIMFIGDYESGVNKEQVRNEINSIDSSWICEDSVNSSLMYHSMVLDKNYLNFIVQIIVLVVGSLVLVYSFVTCFDEKVDVIAILKAVGWGNKKILLFLFSEPMLLVLIAGILVYLVFYIVMNLVFMYYFPEIDLVFNFSVFITLFGVVVCCGLIGFVYYLWVLRRIELANM